MMYLDRVEEKANDIIGMVRVLENRLTDLEDARSGAAEERDELRQELEKQHEHNEADAELLGQFVREARRAVRGSETIITAGRGDYREFYRLLEAVEKIDWIEK